jgi:hypothetical protein
MMELAKNPVLAERKANIFKKRELKRMGVEFEHELTLEQRGAFQAIIERNIGPKVFMRIEERASKFQDKLSETGKNKFVTKEEA